MKFIKVQLSKKRKRKKSNEKGNTKPIKSSHVTSEKYLEEYPIPIKHKKTQTNRSYLERQKRGRFSRFCYCRGLQVNTRSEVMYLCQLFMDRDALFPTIAELGRLCLIQFDRPSLNSRYDALINLCTLLEKDIEMFLHLLNEYNIPSKRKADDIIEPIIPNSPAVIDNINHELEKLTSTYREITEAVEPLEYNYDQLNCQLIALRRFVRYIDDDYFSNSEHIYISEELYKNFNIVDFFIGVIRKERVARFEQALWRFCSPGFFFRCEEIDEKDLFKVQSKREEISSKRSSFYIFVLGEEIRSRLQKICRGYEATLFYCPRTKSDRKELIEEIELKKFDLKRIIMRSHQRKLKLLSENADKFYDWQTQICVLKSILFVCNTLRLDVTRNVYVAELWLARKDMKYIQISLNTATLNAGHTVLPMLIRIRTKRTPPTYYKRNKFTRGFQTIIDAYGYAQYREISPAIFTIITFPFLFAVMFGDVGHGSILVICAIALILTEKRYKNKKITNEIYKYIFEGRYIILMMGVFSIYVGFIYNEIFGKPIYFGNYWNLDEFKKFSDIEPIVELNLKTTYVRPPPFGTDLLWSIALNRIIISNSYKMKISIILGVTQMVFGLILKAFNAHYFKNNLSILLEVIPMLLFLLCLFGYLVVLIIVKWVTYSALKNDPYSPKCAPLILVKFIDMIMMKKRENIPENCNEYMFPFQGEIEIILLTVALVSVPVLLLGKPIHVCYKKRLKKLHDTVVDHRPTIRILEENRQKTDNKQPMSMIRRQSTLTSMKSLLKREANLSNITYDLEDLQEDHEEMSEVMIYQGVHTIDSVIGSVSHTASYLRLWALSLAHSEMSDVLWDMILRVPLQLEQDPTYIINAIILTIIFALWAIFSIIILVVMEGLSTFLHTTRLHWVEFQSKFYYGSGSHFNPFCFKNILNE